MENKNQHFVPRSYLERFTDPATPYGQTPYLWVHERGGETPYRRAPKKVAAESYYYSYTDPATGQRDDSVDKLLQKIETSAAPVLRRLVEGEAPDALSGEEREWLAAYLGFLALRVPHFRNLVEQQTAEVARMISLTAASRQDYFLRTVRESRKAKQLPELSDEEIEKLRQFVLGEEYTITTNPTVSLAQMLPLSLTVADYMLRFPWRVLEAPASAAFITSDNPVVKVPTWPAPPFYAGTVGWATPGMEATIPLSTRRCLVLGFDIEPGVELVTLAIVQEINWRVAARANLEVYSSQPRTVEELNAPGPREHWPPLAIARSPVVED